VPSRLYSSYHPHQAFVPSDPSAKFKIPVFERDARTVAQRFLSVAYRAIERRRQSLFFHPFRQTIYLHLTASAQHLIYEEIVSACLRAIKHVRFVLNNIAWQALISICWKKWWTGAPSTGTLRFRKTIFVLRVALWL